MDYQLTQTGEQVQNILNQAPTTEQSLQVEIARATAKEGQLETAIGNETTRAEAAEEVLRDSIANNALAISNETTRAEAAESVLRVNISANTDAISAEKTRAEGVEGTLSTGLANEEIRAREAESNLQLNINAEALTRDHADDMLQEAIDAIDAMIPVQASPSNQLADKAFVNSSISTSTATFKGTYNSLEDLERTVADANDYGYVVSTDSAGNTVYNRYKYVEGQGWMFEYALNNSSFTADEWAAIKSGITAALTAKLNGLPDIDALNAMFAEITSKIPVNASSSNKLVDYAQLVAALATKQNTLTFDNVPTENSSNPVKSGGVYSAIATVTAAIVGLQSSKQDVLTFDQYPTAGSNNPVRSTGIYSAIENAVALKANQSALTDEVTRAQNAEGALSARISTNASDIAVLQSAYEALTQSDIVVVEPTDTWPVANPQENVIYRVVDRENTPPEYYTDYMWNGTSMVPMAQYDNAIDDVPTEGSNNLVKSGGVFAAYAYSTFNPQDSTEFAKVSPYIRNVFIVPKSQSAFNTLKTTQIRLSYIGVKAQQFSEKLFAIQISDSDSGAKQVALDSEPDLSKTLIYKLDQIYANSDFMRSLDVYVEFVAGVDLSTTAFVTINNNGVLIKALNDTNISLFKEMLILTASDKEPTLGSEKFAESGGIYNMFTTFTSTSASELAKVTQYLKNLYLVPKNPEDLATFKSLTDLKITYIGCDTPSTQSPHWNNHPFGIQITCKIGDTSYYINKELTYKPDLTQGTIFKLDRTGASNSDFLRSLEVYADFNIDADLSTENFETVRNPFVMIRKDTTFTSLFKETQEKDIVYLITQYGDGDFVNLKECLDYVNTLSGYNHITINIGYGEYDMRSWYTNEEWNAVGFKGLVIPKNVSIIGVGRKRSDVLITCTSETPMSEVSLFHLTDNATIKNLTLYANNLRYVVHDDNSDYGFANTYGSYRDIENCDFIAENTQRNFVYGAGTNGGADWHFKNCRFINKGVYSGESGCFSVHDKYDPNGEIQATKDEKYVFEDCEFIGHHQSDIRICPANGGVEETFILERCKFKKVYVTSGYTGLSNSTTIFNVLGSGNSKDVLWGYRLYAAPSGSSVYNERKTIPKFSDTVISGINTDSSAIVVGDYCKYDAEYGIIKGTQSDNIGVALLGADVGDVVYVSNEYEFTYSN